MSEPKDPTLRVTDVLLRAIVPVVAFGIAMPPATAFGAAADKPAVGRPGVRIIGVPWRRHAIDASSRGADGVRLLDIDGDGDRDAVSAWEEGGLVRIYRHPPAAACRHPWPAVTVGRVGSPEDAVLVDLDRDGAVDAVSCCEGRTRSVFLHRAPAPATTPAYWNPRRWRTICPSATKDRGMWMFCEPVDVNGDGRSELFVGAKGAGAVIGCLQSPHRVWDPATWHFRELHRVGWVMSLIAADRDGDGRMDLLVSDRRGSTSGVFWLLAPNRSPRSGGGNHASAAARRMDVWRRHDVGALGEEVMFLHLADLDRDGTPEVIAAIRPRTVAVFRRSGSGHVCHRVELATEAIGTMKSVRIARWGTDGRPRVVVSCEHADGMRRGVFWFFWDEIDRSELLLHDISGPVGVKFDLLQLDDVDADGDPDVLTCEERTNLGVLWYENPAVRAERTQH
ncbi:MAG: VCBS repeat-containing protein [Planctomycetota bacterium]|nr:MAG: VCBS repeat-containing protein [Planctomycetota bacterium]